MTLTTRRGVLPAPLHVPVITGRPEHRVEALALPYLPRLARAVMVSAPYLRDLPEVDLPVLADSGGFAALRPGARVEEVRGLGVVHTAAGSVLHPRQVLELQEQRAEVGFTLDLPIPPGLDPDEAEWRLALTVANARWALAQRRRADLPLLAVVQGTGPEGYAACARTLAAEGFEGLALGGLVPRRGLALEIVAAVRAEWSGPLHALGMGEPDLVRRLFDAGVTSVDSSSWARLAASGRTWGRGGVRVDDPSPDERLRLALVNLAVASGTALPVGVRELLLSPWS